MIPGHGFRVFRALVEEGWRLSATCKCGHKIRGIETYADLSALVNDHYRDESHKRRTAKQEAARS